MMFKIGDMVKVIEFIPQDDDDGECMISDEEIEEIEKAFNGRKGKIVRVKGTKYGVDLGITNDWTHTLGGICREDTGRWFQADEIELVNFDWNERLK